MSRLGGGGVDWVASQFPEQPTKKCNAWQNKQKYMGPRDLVKPSSLTNAVTIDRHVICEKFVALPHPSLDE